MDWKREAADKLRKYQAKKEALRSIPEEIRMYEEMFNGIRSASADSTPVAGGGSTQEDMLLSNIAHREELKLAMNQARRWVSIVDRGLATLPEDERLILDRFYIHPAKGNVERLCGELGIEKASVYRRRDAALQHFTIALYGATEQ